MATDALPALTVYSRGECHLCDQMLAGLRHLQATYCFRLTVVDVDDDPELKAAYGDSVPVLTGEGRVLWRHFLDTQSVTAFLRQFL
jgi:hypothetical protein